MPINANNHYYPNPVTLATAVLSPQIITADASLPATPFSFEGAKDIFAQLNVHQHLVTALAGANNDLVFIALAPGVQSVTVTYAVAGNNTPLSVGVVGQDITVNIATNGGGAAISTAAQIMAAIQASAAASALVVVSLAAGNDGTGVVIALAKTSLGNPTGTSPTLDVTLKHGLISTFMATHSAFGQKTIAASELKAFTAVGSSGQWFLHPGGTTPVFAVSINVVYRP